MNKHIIKIMGLGVVAASLSLASCDDFLDRPTESSFTVNDYFQNDDQLISSVNTLYASPWNDYLRGIFNIGDKLAGNWYSGDDVFMLHTVNAGNTDMIQAENALWCVIAHANTTLVYLKQAEGDITESVRNQCIGEAMVMKAMAYFYLVRAWGSMPIIHNTSEIIANASSFDLDKVNESCVYDYIINTVYNAMSYLPKKNGTDGRIDYYSAEGLLAKVYLAAAAAKDGTLNQACLDKAKEYAADVIEHSGRSLEENYEDLFRYSTGHMNPEGLITLHWKVSASRWTINNWTQPDMVAAIFGGTGSGWGEWGGPSVALQETFGVNVLDASTIAKTSYAHVDNAVNLTKNDATVTYSDVDRRRMTEMNMYGDYYSYWWRNEGGFINTWNNNYNVCNAYAGESAATTVFSSGTGAQCSKYVYGNAEDHIAETGESSSGMCGSMQTFLLRLADVYLVYVEATMPPSSDADTRSTSDAKAVEYFNAVRSRAHAATATAPITFDMLMKERRKELAYEGDNWFDYVREADYDLEDAYIRLLDQNRVIYSSDGLNKLYKGEATAADFVEGGTYAPTEYSVTSVVQNAEGKKFRLPLPQTDITANPKLGQPAVEYDFSDVDYYDPSLYKNL